MQKEKKRVLVLNVGSLTLKFAVFSGLKEICRGVCEDIGGSESKIIFNAEEKKTKIKNHADALKLVLDYLLIKGIEFDVICHRVVHGGKYNKTTKIDESVKKEIRKFSEIAPNHNPFELLVIEKCEKLAKPQYAVFDTSFFSDLPEKAKIYPIPQDICRKYEIKRYGFHGTSHFHVSRGLNGKIITCHLGNGCSLTALEDGKPIDTSMGFTPLEGVMMGTRAGSIDPGILVFLEKRGYNVGKLISEQSGFKAFTKEIDFRFIKKHLNERKIKLAYELFVYSIAKQIGAYVAVLGGLDNLVFTGGLGEHNDFLREDICKYLKFLSIEIDKEKNKNNSEIISSKKSKVKVFVKKTDEEKIMAEEVLKLLR